MCVWESGEDWLVQNAVCTGDSVMREVVRPPPLPSSSLYESFLSPMTCKWEGGRKGVQYGGPTACFSSLKPFALGGTEQCNHGNNEHQSVPLVCHM